jgi:CBS domain containing-hemolysin-like protein
MISAHFFVTQTMNAPPPDILTARPRSRRGALFALILLGAALLPQSAHASLFHGETLDAVANGMAWVVLVVVPLVLLTVFWLLHILPEKIAHKKHHPQTKAIQCLCLLSLFFGGLLWPLAWIWAYTKPVLHKMAYGTDVEESHEHEHDAKPPDETERLRLRVAELENQLSRKGVA